MSKRTDVDWDDPNAFAIDGFTVSEITDMVFDSVADAVCEACGAYRRVEPDADGYDCHDCGTPGSVTSPLVKLGLV